MRHWLWWLTFCCCDRARQPVKAVKAYLGLIVPQFQSKVPRLHCLGLRWGQASWRWPHGGVEWLTPWQLKCTSVLPGVFLLPAFPSESQDVEGATPSALRAVLPLRFHWLFHARWHHQAWAPELRSQRAQEAGGSSVTLTLLQRDRRPLRSSCASRAVLWDKGLLCCWEHQALFPVSV